MSCALVVLARPGGAQDTDAPAAPAPAERRSLARQPQPPCDGRIVTGIVITTRPPYGGALLRRVPMIGRVGQALHVTTRPGIIRRYVLLDEDQPCTELRRSESERLLRAQPFIADARVTAIPEDGGVRIEVETIDELSVIVGGGIQSQSPMVNAVRLGEGNLMGEGIYVSGEWRDGGAYRDEFAGRVADYQLFGRPYHAEVLAARTERGSRWYSELSHPFFTDLQRTAWRVAGGAEGDYVRFVREAGGRPALRAERRFTELSGLVRIGVPGRLSLFGASLTHEREVAGDAPVIISDSGLVADTTSELFGRYGSHTGARANALWGVRNLNFLRVTGFDALSGSQDMRRGFQLGTQLGRSLSVIGSDDDDIFVFIDLYAGNGTPNAFFAFQMRGEGRQNHDQNHWDGIFSSGRAAGYIRLHRRHTLLPSFEWGMGWRSRVPFQLSLADHDGGIRGYAGSLTGGAQRGVFRLEERWFLGRPRRLADVGLSVFGDAGRIWAGDAPFGVDTKVKVGAGVGLLVAVPPRSKRLWRLDVAFPLSDDPHAKWELRLSSRDATRVFWREPDDMQRGREASIRSSIFAQPSY